MRVVRDVIVPGLHGLMAGAAIGFLYLLVVFAGLKSHGFCWSPSEFR